MSDKKVCEVCGRPGECGAGPYGRQGCHVLGYERERAKAAILTPEVLRLIEAGREYGAAYHDESRDDRPEVALLLQAALALPFEKPAESNHTAKQQLPKKGGE